MKRNLGIVLVCLALLAAGCSRQGSRTDAQVASEVQDKINGDGNVPDKINVNANSGVVTLSGTVSSDTARNAAGSDAGQIAGVKTVINNLQVVPASAANQTSQPQPQSQPQEQASNNPPPTPPVRTEQRPSPSARRKNSNSRSTASNSNKRDEDYGDGQPKPLHEPDNNGDNSNNGSANTAQSSAPVAPPAPTPAQKITIPSGTQISIRLNDEVNSEKAQIGDVFHGSISAPISIDEQPVIPTTADVEGRVVNVKSAGKFAGDSVLTLELTKLTMNGRTYTLQTNQWSQSGAGKGKTTATKVGGGAAVGAILGGIFGGGKGAAIGAAAGAGAGTGVSAATNKAQQIILKPEAIIAFQLQTSVTVTPGASRSTMNND